MSNCTLLNMCMIYDSADRVLVQDKIHPRWPGITFPGGHVENGESIYESTIREIREETGLTISNLCPIGFIHMHDPEAQTRRIIFCYKTSTFCGNLVDKSHEGRVFWVDRDTLKHLQLSPNMEEYLRLFFDDDIVEVYITPDFNSKNNFTFFRK